MTAVTRSQLRADRRRWDQARSLTDLGELTALWLEGTILHQPGYADPRPGETGPDPETLPLVPVLAACNRAGFVTTASQPGESDWSGRGWAQRAAVEGFCDTATWARLRAAARAAGLTVVAHDPATLPRHRSRMRNVVPVTRDHHCRPLTYFGTHLSRAHLANEHAGYGECHADAVRALTAAWQVTIIDPDWGRNDVLWPALAAFTSAGNDMAGESQSGRKTHMGGIFHSGADDITISGDSIVIGGRGGTGKTTRDAKPAARASGGNVHTGVKGNINVTGNIIVGDGATIDARHVR